MRGIEGTYDAERFEKKLDLERVKMTEQEFLQKLKEAGFTKKGIKEIIFVIKKMKEIEPDEDIDYNLWYEHALKVYENGKNKQKGFLAF